MKMNWQLCGPSEKSFFASNIVCLSLIALVLGLSFAIRTYGAVNDTQSDDAASELSRSFRCPEDYPSEEAKRAALNDFIREYSAKFPNNNVRDMLLFRYHLLVTHSCIQTLKSMLANVSPLTEMLSIQNQDFGPKTEELDTKTKVWSVYFRRNGEPAATTDEELIFNFYGWNPPTSAASIASAFINRNDNVRILGKFEAPDDLTRQPAYFIVSETLYPGETYGFLNISKISSVGTGAYTVTFCKKISGGNIEEKGKAWVTSKEGQDIAQLVGHIGVDASWEQHFASQSTTATVP